MQHRKEDGAVMFVVLMGMMMTAMELIMTARKCISPLQLFPDGESLGI